MSENNSFSSKISRNATFVPVNDQRCSPKPPLPLPRAPVGSARVRHSRTYHA